MKNELTHIDKQLILYAKNHFESSDYKNDLKYFAGEDIADLGYDDWCEALNQYLNELYDIGDTTVKYVSFSNKEQFMWVG